MSDKIKWGILGLGKIAHTFAQDLVNIPEAHLQAVGSRSLEKAKEFATTYSATTYYSSYQELVEDPDIDIIYIATPHALHYENTMMCLYHGKSVLCEKPMAMNAQQAQEMINLAIKKNLFLMQGVWTRFIPATIKVLELLYEKQIGAISYVRADFGFRVNAPPESRLLDPQLGGGALLDIGIYPLYLSLLLLGEPEELKAEAILDANGIDRYCTVLGSFKNHTKSIMECSFLSNTSTEAFIYGSTGFIHMKSKFHQCEEILIHDYDSKTDIVYKLPRTGHGYSHEIEETHRCLKDGKTESDLLPHSMSLSLIKNLDRIRELIGLKYDV
jgi:predicted dehydrogenase